MEDSSYGNHLEGDDPKREGGHDSDFFSHRSTAPLLLGSHIVFFHLALGQRQQHLGDPQIQRKQSQEGFEQPTHFGAVHNSQMPVPIQSCSHCFQDYLHTPYNLMDRNHDAFRDPGFENRSSNPNTPTRPTRTLAICFRRCSQCPGVHEMAINLKFYKIFSLTFFWLFWLWVCQSCLCVHKSNSSD